MSKQWYASLLLSVSSLSIAGSMGDDIAKYSGFWLGAGGSYTYSTLNGETNILQVSTAPSSSEYLLSHNILNHMAPVVNAGYYLPVREWLIGPKFLYKYIGQEQFDQSWSGTYQDGAYQTAGLRTESVQNYYLLLSGAYQFENWLLYGGVGPGWADVKVELNGSLLGASSLIFTPYNTSHSKTIIGGAAQVGFEYMLPKQFMVDISYNFLATPTTAISPIIFRSTGSSYSSFGQSVNVVEQGINITLNKYFS